MEQLTNKEEEIMQALWSLEKAFVKEIVAALPDGNHYNTVSTIVRNLADKGFIAHTAFGKTHQYYPTVSKEEYTKGQKNGKAEIERLDRIRGTDIKKILAKNKKALEWWTSI